MYGEDNNQGEPAFTFIDFLIAVSIVAAIGAFLYVGHTEAAEPSTSDEPITKAEDLSEEEISDMREDNKEINERNKKDEAMNNPDRTDDERKQALADEIANGDAGALDGPRVMVYCTLKDGDRSLVGGYLDQEAADVAIESQSNPSDCYSESE